MSDPNRDITFHLRRLAGGDASAQDVLLPLIYAELRSVAGNLMRNQAPGHTLQPTALVHEAWLKIVRVAGAEFEGRGHFVAVAAKAMRQVLVNHARDRRATKRGGGAEKLPLDESLALVEQNTGDLVAVDDALQHLAAEQPRAASVFELRVFGGMSIEEAAEALGVGPTTVKADWRFARAWLRRAIDDDGGA